MKSELMNTRMMNPLINPLITSQPASPTSSTPLEFPSASQDYEYSEYDPTLFHAQQSPFYSPDAKNTLWMGDLDIWMDEAYVKTIWLHYGETVGAKLIRDKFTGQSAGYCFVEFSTHAAATKALVTLNGTFIPNSNKLFRLNWASGGGLLDKKDIQGPEYSIFVGDLGSEVTDTLLHLTFLSVYPSCKCGKVVTDPITGLSRGYGFVRFSDESEQQRAMVEMQGRVCGSRPMRISVATPKQRNAFNHNSILPGNNLLMNNYWHPTQSMNYHDPTNTTVFVGGLVNGFIAEDDLLCHFASYGPIIYVKIPPGKGCGFVSFVHRSSAEQAIAQLNGCVINGNRIRLSWGRNSSIGTPSNALLPIKYGQNLTSHSLGTNSSLGMNNALGLNANNWSNPFQTSFSNNSSPVSSLSPVSTLSSTNVSSNVSLNGAHATLTSAANEKRMTTPSPFCNDDFGFSQLTITPPSETIWSTNLGGFKLNNYEEGRKFGDEFSF